MKIDIYEAKDLLVAHGKDVEEIVRRAARQALLEHKRAGNSVAAWVDGKAVVVEADDIPVDDSP